MNPSYAYPHALVSTLLETARKQFFSPSFYLCSPTGVETWGLF